MHSAIAFAVGVMANRVLDHFQGAKSKKGRKKKKKADQINLASVAAGAVVGMVPVHGFLKRSGFLARMGGMAKGAMGGWFGFALRSAGIAALIGSAVAVFNRFSEKWSGMGLPLVMPITAAVQNDNARTSRPYSTYGHSAYPGSTRQDPVRTGAVGSLGEYVG